MNPCPVPVCLPPPLRAGGLLGFLVLFLAAAGQADRLAAEPIAPVGLKELFERAHCVVIGEVTKVEPTDPARETKPECATLQVSSVLKGPPTIFAGDRVAILFNTLVNCPADAYFESGGRYLAFLEPPKTSPQGGVAYRTVALSYGGKRLGPGTEPIYRTRIEELKNLLHLPSGDRLRLELASWYLRCTLEPATREEGLLGLDYWSYWGSFAPWSDVEKPTDEVGPRIDDEVRYWRFLTRPQIHQLVGVLRTMNMEGGFPSEAAAMLRIVAKRLASPELTACAKRFEEADPDLENRKATSPHPEALQRFLEVYDRAAK